MAHVTLIRPPFVQPMDMINQTEGTPSLGLAYLLGSLKDHGHDVCAVDAFGEDVNRLATITNIEAKGILINGIGAEKIVSMIPKHTDVIGITCMFSNEWLYARYIINQIKLNFPRVPIIAGGEHITSESYRSMLYTPALTACALGEGEEIINDLVDALVAGKNLADVRGIAYFDENGNYRKTERRLRIKEVDDIPLPSWEEIPIENYLAAGLGNGTLERRAMPMLASRGCPYTCTFCSSPSMWGIRWVSRNPRLVVDEIKSYIRRYKINHIDFNDLTTVINRAWIIEFCQLLISENLGITWSLSSGTRSEALDHEVLGYMKRAGIQRITYAPESGSETTLERVKKKVNLEKMTGSIRSSVKVGIYSRANFIFGLPDQTKFEAFESVAFATKLCFLGMYDIACMCFAPYPGSELFERMIREGGIKTDHSYNEFLINNLTTKMTGMKSWSKYIPSWSMPLWTIGTTIYFYSLQFILRPHRLFQLCYRLITRKPTTMFETIVFGLFVSFFRRKKLVVKEVEPIEAINPPLDKKIPNKESDDPLILINSGNPARGLI
ncbi:MAG: B12-binding domain-containing radical SAM protein [Candidatus Binatia bacterium]